ncbi:Presequence protease 1 [Chlorella vulgaris]
MLSRAIGSSALASAATASGLRSATRSVPQSSALRAALHFRAFRGAAVPGLAALQQGLGRQAARRQVQSARVSAVAAPVEAEAAPAPQHAHGFSLVEQQYVGEYGSTVLLYRHDKTGAQLMSVVNSDENKTFGVTFRTPVANSKGVPHILEHSVLCGSRKYPIKEPFVELMKGSLQTFLNAFTYPDRTCYPVASCNLQDFYNLVDVYLDAVLHPACVQDPRIFAQEGWHYELDDPSAPLTYKGVVFNEMKGVYSSPDSVNNRVTQAALFPDNTYVEDSGGDPKAIPELTFEEFQKFYADYYHPSNARFWFYGDDPVEERLRIVDAYLQEFEARPVDSSVKPQPLFKEPRRVVGTYSAGEGSEDGGEPRAFVSVNWLLTEEPLDLETELALGFLNHLMLGTSASPLRKALNDSGLGESLIGGGVEDELAQPVFSLGLKGVKEEDAPKVEALILETLERLEKEGFSSTAVEAAVNTIEFSLRENNTGRFPRGLSLMLRSMAAWIYDRDPFQPLKWQDDLEHFKGRLAAGEDVFGPLIRRYLLDNPHRVTVELRPDPKLGEEIEAGEQQRLEAVRGGMAERDLKEVVASTEELKQRQETPDAAEALGCIPSLSLSDIPKKIATTPTTVSDAKGGATLLTHDLFTNDVLYLDVALDLKPVPANLLPLVPLFCRCLTQMGTDKESFIELTERIGRKTGGVSVSPSVLSKKGSAEPLAYVTIRGKAMADKAGDMFDVARDMLLSARLDDRERFKQMVLETKSSMEAGVIGAGHSFAASRLDAQRSVAGWASEQMGGVAYLDFIRGLAARVESDWEGVQADLEAIRKVLLQRKGVLVNMTGDERTLGLAAGPLSSFLDSLPASSAAAAAWTADLKRQNEALLVPTQVNYVSKAANLYEDAGYQLSGSSYVISKSLSTSWIWDRVRVSGGAYGGYCDFDTHSGMFTYSSYRDPNLLKTVDVYDGTVDFLSKLEMGGDELSKAIIGTIGDLDSYQLPDSKGRTAFMRHILGITEEERQQRRDEVLGTSVADFRAFADVLAAVRDQGQVVAVTSADRLEAAHAERPGFFDAIKKPAAKCCIDTAACTKLAASSKCSEAGRILAELRSDGTKPVQALKTAISVNQPSPSRSRLPPVAPSRGSHQTLSALQTIPAPPSTAASSRAAVPLSRAVRTSASMFAATVAPEQRQQRSRSTLPQPQSSSGLSDSSTTGCATADGGLILRQQFAEALYQHFGAVATGGKVAPETVRGKLLKSSSPGGMRMRGVTRHKRTQRYEGHIWESKKQVYLGAYDTEALAGTAHDIMALRCRGLAGATVLNFPPECYTPLLPLIGRLSRDEVVAALRDCSRNQSSSTHHHHHSGLADGSGRQQLGTSLAARRSQAGSHAAAAHMLASGASRVRKAGSPAAPALTINVRRRVYSAADSEVGSPASPKRLGGKMPPRALWPPGSPAAATPAAAASWPVSALSAAGVGCGSLPSTAAGDFADTFTGSQGGLGSASPLLSMHCQQSTSLPGAALFDAPTVALHGGAVATAATDAAHLQRLMKLQRRTQQQQQQAAVQQEKAGSELFAGAAAGDLWPTFCSNRPALSFLEGMEAGMELERPMAELNSLIFSASDDAYLFQPSMLTPASSPPTSCTAMEHVNGTMLLTDRDQSAGPPAAPPATPTAAAAQQAAAKAQAEALAATLGEMEQDEELAAEQLMLPHSPPPLPSLQLGRVPPQAPAVLLAPPPLPPGCSASVLGPSSAQPANWSTINLWPQPSAAATHPGYFPPGRLLPSTACATATAAPLGSNRITAPPAAAEARPSSPGRLVTVLPAAAVPNLPHAAVPATLSLPVRYTCPYPYPYPCRHPFSYPQPPSSIDAVRAASIAALQHAGLLRGVGSRASPRPDQPAPLTWGIQQSHSSSSSSSSAVGECPLTYRRLSVSEVRGGSPKPYLLGGPQQPQCTNCKRSGQWADICQFKSGDLVALGRRYAIISSMMARYEDIVTGGRSGSYASGTDGARPRSFAINPTRFSHAHSLIQECATERSNGADPFIVMSLATVRLEQQQQRSRSSSPRRQSTGDMSTSSTSGCTTASDDGLRSRQHFVEALQEHFRTFGTGGKVSPETVIGMHLKSSNPGGSRMRGVTCHKRTQRYEGHIWESKKQVYLGAYDTEALAGTAHDIMALRCKGLAGAKMLNFPSDCYTSLLTLIGRLSREEVVAALRDCSRNQSSSTHHHHSGAADGGRGKAASSLAPGDSQAGSHAAAPTMEATLASRVRKAGSAAAPVLTINVRRRVYTAAGSERGNPFPASPKRLSGKMPPCTLWPPCSPVAPTAAAAAASCVMSAVSAGGAGCSALPNAAAVASAGTFTGSQGVLGSVSPLFSRHCQLAAAFPGAGLCNAPTAALNGGVMATAATDAARHHQVFQLQCHTQQHQQVAAVDQEMAGSELFAGTAAGDLPPSSRPKRPALNIWDGMDAGLELGCRMAESQSLVFNASDDAYLFQPPMLSPASSLPTSCIGMEHVNGTMLLTDRDQSAGPPAAPPATPTAAAAQQAAAEAQAPALADTLEGLEQGKESAAEQLLLHSPPPLPSLRLSGVPPLAPAVPPVAPHPTTHVYSGSVLAPSSAQPAAWSNQWPQPSLAAMQPHCFQPGRLLPSNACVTATAALLANNRLTAPPAPAEPRLSRPGRLVTVLPAAAVHSLPDASMPATLSLPVRYPNPYLNPYGYPYHHPFSYSCFYSNLRPPSSIDAVRAASMAALQHGGSGSQATTSAAQQAPVAALLRCTADSPSLAEPAQGSSAMQHDRQPAMALVWKLTWSTQQSHSSSSSSSTAVGECPLTYRRLSVSEVRGGSPKPYLLGGPQQPQCTNCKRSGQWADICQFKSGDLCADWLFWSVLEEWLGRGYELALQLTPCDLWPLLRGRTLFLLGDSQMLDFYKAVQCFLFEFWPSLEQRDLTADAAAQQQFSTVLRSTCVDLLQGTRVCYIRADKGTDLLTRVLPLLASLPGLAVPSRDLLVVNFGLHHDRSDYRQQLAAFAAYHASNAAALPRLLWQPTPAQHFAGSDGSGEYPGGQPPFQCEPLPGIRVEGEGRLALPDGGRDRFGLLRGGWRNAAADSVMRRAGIPILPSYNESVWMHAFHRDNGAGLECTHFCHPSTPQTWVLALFKTLRDLRLDDAQFHQP